VKVLTYITIVDTHRYTSYLYRKQRQNVLQALMIFYVFKLEEKKKTTYYSMNLKDHVSDT
jgi:hypothetical protein